MRCRQGQATRRNWFNDAM